MSTPTWGLDPKSRRITVYYDGTSTIREGMPLCYNYNSTDNWLGVSSIDFTTTASSVTESGTTAEGNQNEGKFIRVFEPTVANVTEVTPADGSAVLTHEVAGDPGEYEAEGFNNIKVNQWVTITGTDVTNGTYKVTAVTQGEDDTTAGTMTLDMDDATGTTADVRVIIDNSLWHAGAVAGADHDGETGPKALDIYVPNGAIVPVRTDKDCSIGDSIGLEDGEEVYTAVTGDGSPVPCAQVMETINRSSTNGLVLAKLFETGQQITGANAHFKPVRGKTGSRVYGVKIDGDSFFVGTTAAQSYLLELSGDKAADYDTTGDGYSAYLHISGSNYAQNDTNYTYRGINCGIANRSGGTLGSIYGANISISLKSSSGNITNGIACQIDAQDLTSGTKTCFGGLDVSINREGAAATEEFGMRLRTRGTINTAMNTVFRIDKDAADHGFVNLFNIETDAVDVISASGDLTFTTSDILIPIVFNTNTYYIVCTDNT